jgi:hypothetical protein
LSLRWVIREEHVNLRRLVGIDEPYFQFDREERHLAAILFHLLNHRDNAERALHSVEPGWKINPEEFGVYFEYSYPRDLWHKLGDRAESNNRKRDVIIRMLGMHGFDTRKLASLTAPEAFNAFFIEPNHASRKYIQSPANWNLTQIAKSVPLPSSNIDLLTACKIKWAFKAKPDIVIHSDLEHALCIELKLEAGEGSYPSDADEKELLRARGLFGEKKKDLQLPMRQTDLQKFLMTELLGLDCRFRLITRYRTSGSECVSWSDFLGLLEPLPTLPPYIVAAVKLAHENP